MTVLGGHNFKSLLKLSNGWTDWHQIWHTYANGYTPNKLPFETQGGGHLGVLGGQTFKSLESRHSAGLIGTNFGSRLRIHLEMDIYAKNKSPHNTPGDIGGGLGGHKFKCLGKLSDCSTDWYNIWYMSADSSGNGHC